MLGGGLDTIRWPAGSCRRGGRAARGAPWPLRSFVLEVGTERVCPRIPEVAADEY